MSDMLDFYGDFWENLLDCQPPTVDNKCTEGDLTYAASDYLGVYPRPVRMSELGKAKAEWLRYSTIYRKARTASAEHYSIEN